MKSFHKSTSSRTAFVGLKGWFGDSPDFTVNSGYKYPGIRTISTELPSKLNSGTSDVHDIQKDVEVPDCMRAASGSR